MSWASTALHRNNGKILPTIFGSTVEDDEIVTTASEFGVVARKMRLESGATSGSVEALRLDQGFYLLRTDFEVQGGYETRVIGEDLIEFHYRLSGSLGLYGQWGEVAFSEPSLLCWHQPFGCDGVWETLRGRELSVTLYVSPEWLRRMLGADCGPSLPPFLFDALSQSRQPHPCYRLMPAHPTASAILDELRHTQLSGALRMLHAKAKALELLCVSISSLQELSTSGSENKFHFSDREWANIAEARTILTTEYAGSASIAWLARRVGLNANKLGHGFKQRYGEAPHEFLRRTRLERARDLLVSTDLQVGQVALQVGYAHHSTFTKAFTDHFQISPATLARQRRIYGKTPKPTLC